MLLHVVNVQFVAVQSISRWASHVKLKGHPCSLDEFRRAQAGSVAASSHRHYNHRHSSLSSSWCWPRAYDGGNVTFAGTRHTEILGQLLVALLILFLHSGPADAHSVVIESSPKENEVLTRAPSVVVLRFSAKIEKSLTRVSLSTTNGRMIPLPTAVEKSSSETPDRLEIRLPGLEPGEYVLRYTVLSTDGHATSGALHFRVVSRP